MYSNLKSFFLFTSSALVLLFILSSLFAYIYFDLSTLLNSTQQSELFIGVFSVFSLLLIVLYLLAKKFLFPILELRSIAISQKEGKTYYKFTNDFHDEVSFISDHLIKMKEELEKEKDILKQLALVDELTGIKNRRYFFEFGEGIFKLAKRNKEDLSLIIFEVDHLDLINSKHGSETGNNLLKLLTEVTELYIRKSDILSRFSDEEFVVLLPHTSTEHAYIVAKKIQGALETPNFKNKVDTTFTISMGISSFSESDILLRDMTQRAEQALSTAKEKGGNNTEAK